MAQTFHNRRGKIFPRLKRYVLVVGNVSDDENITARPPETFPATQTLRFSRGKTCRRQKRNVLGNGFSADGRNHPDFS
ncbi:MAG: hypothetical protein JWM68_4723 [Verrucomicrobiales bacterium]|nr:hypothetical protein [Verrucomicrobiales bacterium]